jgi:spore germination protein GerM
MRRRVKLPPIPQSRAAIIALAAAGALLLFMVVLLFRGNGDGDAASVPPGTSAAETPAGDSASRSIAARIFYVAEDGRRLVGLEREVPFASDPADQAREIVRAQVAAPESPLVSAVPAGTTLRALFLTPRGEAYVDLSGEVSAGHSGGSVAELLTVYAIVHALTVNLPAVTSVQILVEGREVDTLAGHVNLRRPFAPNPDWID